MRAEEILDPANLVAPMPSPQTVADWFSKAEDMGPNPLAIADDPRVKQFLDWMLTDERPVYDPEPSPQPEIRYLRDPSPSPRIEYRLDPRSSMRPR
ncbi:MAG: hypothetical protein ING19_21660 [Azospirillum sp.]|nr:hypothetical protein [Azospirillum sp.]